MKFGHENHEGSSGAGQWQMLNQRMIYLHGVSTLASFLAVTFFSAVIDRRWRSVCCAAPCDNNCNSCALRVRPASMRCQCRIWDKKLAQNLGFVNAIYWLLGFSMTLCKSWAYIDVKVEFLRQTIPNISWQQSNDTSKVGNLAPWLKSSFQVFGFCFGRTARREYNLVAKNAPCYFLSSRDS